MALPVFHLYPEFGGDPFFEQFYMRYDADKPVGVSYACKDVHGILYRILVQRSEAFINE